MMPGMLKQDKITLFILVSFLISSCNFNQIEFDKRFSIASKRIVPPDKYKRIFNNASDSILSWAANRLGYYKYCGESKNCYLDSLLCFNSSGNRFIGCILKQQLLEEGVADDIDFFYGEKINNQWFYFSGANVFIPREMYKDQNIHTPLSYQQLHQAALKNIYSGYLKNGQINEAWFTEHFEGIGWGDFQHQETSDEYLGLKGKRFTNRREFFEAIHLQSVKNNWVARDTTQPLVPLPVKNLP